MKKKNDDRQSVADLLKKLQESYLGSAAKSAKKKKDPDDVEDEKFQRQLAAMLGKAEKSASAKKKSKKKTPSPAPTEEIDEEAIPVLTVPEEESSVTKELPETVGEEPATAEEAPVTTAEEPARPEEEIFFEEPAAVEPEEPAAIESEEPLPAPIKPKAKRQKRAKKAVETETANERPEEEAVTAPEVVEDMPEEAPVEEPMSEDVSVEQIDTVAEEPVGTESIPLEDAEDSEEPALTEAPSPTEPDEAVSSVEDTSTEEPSASPANSPDSMIFISLRKKEEAPAVAEHRNTEKRADESAKAEIEEPSLPSPAEAASAPTSPRDTVIRISPKAPKDKEAPQPKQETRSNEPIRIQPKVSVPPPSNAPDFAKSNTQAKESQPIVIRPDAPKASGDAIVIRPRTADKPAPTPRISQAPTVPSEPIKIGKESKTERGSQLSAPTSESQFPSMQKEKNITIPAPSASPDTDFSVKTSVKSSVSGTKARPAASGITESASKDATQKKNQPSSGKPGASLPKSNANNATFAPTRGKHRRTINSIPLTTLPDDDLEEVLDEAFDELPAEELPFDAPVEIPAEPTPTFISKRRQRKQQSAESGLSATELVRRKSGLSEDDIAMIFELGYENELERLVGHEALKQMKNEHLKHSEQANHRSYRTAFGYRGEEMVSTRQGTVVRAAYLHDRKTLIARLCLTLLLSLVALFADLPHLMGTYLTDLAAPIPLLLPLAGMVTLWVVALLSWRQINAGIRSFFKFSPTPYSLSALLVPIVTVYDVISLFADGDMLKVNFLSCFAFLILAVCDVFRLSTEMRALQLISAEGDKTVLAPAAPRKKKLRQGDKIVKIINDDLGQNMYHVRKASQLTGFFRRFNNMHAYARPFTVVISVAFALSVLSALVDAVYTSSPLSALSSFMTVLMLSAPLSVCLMAFYPIARANRLLASRNCTLIGDESVEEYRQPKTVIFRDSELYTAEKCTEIAVREGDDFKNDLRLAGILFRKLGGTLTRIGESAPGAQSDPPVAIVRIHDDGVEAVVDNRYHMVAGNADFLKRIGIRVPRESTDKILRRTANVSLMYVAIDGVLKLSYEIEYRTSDAFEALICDLTDTCANVAIYSYDPNLNESFLQKSRPDLAAPICAVKPGRFEEDKPLEIVDTGAVALGDPGDIVYPLYAAKGIEALRRFSLRIQLIAALLSALGFAVLTVFGLQKALGILPILGYQLLWIVVSVVASFAELNADKLRFRK